jgi:hypothetical protein
MRAEYLVLIYICLNVVVTFVLAVLWLQHYLNLPEAFGFAAVVDVLFLITLCGIIYYRYKSISTKEKEKNYQMN